MEMNEQAALLSGVAVGIAAGVAIAKIVQHQRTNNSRVSAAYVEALREVNASPSVIHLAEQDMADAL